MNEITNLAFKVVGKESDGALIFEDGAGYRYVSGETIEEFGISNLTLEEKRTLADQTGPQEETTMAAQDADRHHVGHTDRSG